MIHDAHDVSVHTILRCLHEQFTVQGCFEGRVAWLEISIGYHLEFQQKLH